MPVQLRIESDIRKIPSLLNRLTEKSVKKAVARSISESFRSTRTLLTKTIGQQKWVNTRQLPVSKIKERYIKETSNTRVSSSIDSMYAKIAVSGKHPKLKYFFAKRIVLGKTLRNRRPIYGVQTTVLGKTQIEEGAFAKSSKGTIYVRTTGARYPIRPRFGPSFASMAQRTGTLPVLVANARLVFKNNFTRNLSFFESQEKKK